MPERVSKATTPTEDQKSALVYVFMQLLLYIQQTAVITYDVFYMCGLVCLSVFLHVNSVYFFNIIVKCFVSNQMYKAL